MNVSYVELFMLKESIHVVSMRSVQQLYHQGSQQTYGTQKLFL